MEEEADEVEEDTAEEVLEEVESHIKMGFTSHIPPVSLKKQSGTHSQQRHEKYNRRPSTR